MSISRDGLVMSITEIDFNGEVPTDELSDYPMGPEAALCLRVWEIAQTIQAETYERFKKELAKIIPEDLLTWYFTLGMSEGKTASRDIFLL